MLSQNQLAKHSLLIDAVRVSRSLGQYCLASLARFPSGSGCRGGPEWRGGCGVCRLVQSESGLCLSPASWPCAPISQQQCEQAEATQLLLLSRVWVLQRLHFFLKEKLRLWQRAHTQSSGLLCVVDLGGWPGLAFRGVRNWLIFENLYKCQNQRSHFISYRALPWFLYSRHAFFGTFLISGFDQADQLSQIVACYRLIILPGCSYQQASVGLIPSKVALQLARWLVLCPHTQAGPQCRQVPPFNTAGSPSGTEHPEDNPKCSE